MSSAHVAPAELRREVARIRWYHNIDLGGGIVTEGPSNARQRLESLGLPESLEGTTVLDVGAWDGFFSFEAERRGAARVVATDHYSWSGPGWGTKDGFELARRALRSRVEDVDIDVLDLSPETVGVFDLVLFLAVLYHLRDPLLALERVASVTRHQLILETHVDMLGTARPAAAFYPGTELNGDRTNWWGPNPAAVAAMLRAVGFLEVRALPLYSPLHRVRRMARDVVRNSLRRRRPDLSPLRQARIVFHAFR